MKKILYFAMIVLGALACTPDKDYQSGYWDYVGILVQDIPEVAYEDDGAVEIPVLYGNRPTSDKAYTVHYKVTGGTYGADYTVEGSTNGVGTVTVPAGQAGKAAIGIIKIVPIADLITEDDVDITITLESADGDVNVGYPYASEIGLTLGNDDCVYDAKEWVGDYAAVEKYSDGDTDPYDIAFEQDLVDPNKFNTDNFWGSGITAYIIFDPNSRSVTFPDQTNADGHHIVGTGTYRQCSGILDFEVTYTDPKGNSYDFEYVIEKQ